ncbi:MAG: hypothetical protein WBG27_06025, partial [Candidatus Aquilonibacter sp.]
SDDPAYFGGYVADNFEGVATALGLGDRDVITLAKNSFEASFIDDAKKRAHIEEIERLANAARA